MPTPKTRKPQAGCNRLWGEKSSTNQNDTRNFAEGEMSWSITPSSKIAVMANILADYVKALLTGDSCGQLRHQLTLAEQGIFLKTAKQLECELQSIENSEVAL